MPVVLLFLRCAAGRSDCCVSQICTGELPQKVGCDVSQSDGAIGGYFKAQLKIEIWVYLLMLVGFLILRVRYGALISIGIAILDFLRYSEPVRFCGHGQ